ncbi:MAG: AAA family ATPase, partial [Pirellulales bacterium]
MTTATAQDSRESLLSSLLSEDTFRPAEPHSLEEAGVPASLVESLVCKHLSVVGIATGRAIANHLCLPFGVLENVYHDLRTRQIMMHTGSAPLSDYCYGLTEQGRNRAQTYLETCGYIGPAPVPLPDYVTSV